MVQQRGWAEKGVLEAEAILKQMPQVETCPAAVASGQSEALPGAVRRLEARAKVRRVKVE